MSLPDTQRVVITGLGCVTPLGHDVDTVWKALLSGGCAIALAPQRQITTPKKSASRFVLTPTRSSPAAYWRCRRRRD